MNVLTCVSMKIFLNTVNLKIPKYVFLTTVKLYKVLTSVKVLPTALKFLEAVDTYFLDITIVEVKIYLTATKLQISMVITKGTFSKLNVI